jgi:hypothetical protein
MGGRTAVAVDIGDGRHNWLLGCSAVAADWEIERLQPINQSHEPDAIHKF